VFDTDTRFEIAPEAVARFSVAIRDAGPHEPKIEAAAPAAKSKPPYQKKARYAKA
jgi:hypothetical protein